jgi:Spy/CpxP family protein refolding chaperone
MRTFTKTALTLGALALLASPALAQRPGGGFGGGMMGGGAMLLTNKSVQEELKVDSAQVEKLNALASETRTKMQEKMQGLSQEDRMGEKGQAARREVNDEMRKSLANILKADQVKRFDQVELQVRGPQAFADAKVQEKLKLTADQKQKIQAINEGATAQRRELFQGFQNDREGTLKKMTELNKETMTKAAAVLTDDQKATWKEMVGSPFDYKPSPPPQRNN